MLNTDEIIYTNSSRDTEELGEKFAQDLNGGDIVYLYGNLGSGKTTFTKGVAKGLSIASRIISPTFVIVRKYTLPIKSHKIKAISLLYHIDLYRIENLRQIDELGLKEIFEDKHAVTLIEWPEKIQSLLGKKHWNVRFEYRADTERKIDISYE